MAFAADGKTVAINARRGLLRAYVVLSSCFYVWAAFGIYNNEYAAGFSSLNLNRDICRDWVSNASERVPIPFEQVQKYFKGKPITYETCTALWPSFDPLSVRGLVRRWDTDLSFTTAFVLLFPPFLYGVLFGVWKVLVWVGRGFRANKVASS